LISPFAAVFEIAPAKVLHGAVRLHGLTSSPTPDTQVRVACALAGEVPRASEKQHAITANKMRILMIYPLCSCETVQAQTVVFAAHGFYADGCAVSRLSPRIEDMIRAQGRRKLNSSCIATTPSPQITKKELPARRAPAERVG
jgi:hypothetical protein